MLEGGSAVKRQSLVKREISEVIAFHNPTSKLPQMKLGGAWFLRTASALKLRHPAAKGSLGDNNFGYRAVVTVEPRFARGGRAVLSAGP